MNTQYLILSSRTPPHLISMSLELCFCIGNFFAALAPIILKSESKDTPFLYLCTLVILGSITVFNFRYDSSETYNLLLNSVQDEMLQSIITTSAMGDNDSDFSHGSRRKKKQTAFNKILAADIGLGSDGLSS